MLGASPKFFEILKSRNVGIKGAFDFSNLKAVLSTGSPLTNESYDFFYQNFPPSIPLISLSGGTEIMTTFATGCPIRPIWRGQMQAKALGMRVEVFSADGRSVRGEKGELVCTQTFPSQPLGFWGDSAKAAYRATYFELFPGIWRHGDWAMLTEQDGVIIFGRSDSTLNVGGIRIGTAEIYGPLGRIAEIDDAAVVEQSWNGASRAVLFITLFDDAVLDETLVQRVRSVIREANTPRHVPQEIVRLSAIPRTRSGKIAEDAIKKAANNEAASNRATLVNAEALDTIRALYWSQPRD